MSKYHSPKDNLVLDIYYNVYQYNLAKNINSFFNDKNIATHLITDVNEMLFYNKNQKYKKHVLVLLSYTRLNGISTQLKDSKYVIFQLENLIENVNIHKYTELFSNAMYIYDYNAYNLKYYADTVKPKVHVFLPPVYTKDHIDILFYGTLNERRNKILTEIKKKYNVHIVTNVFGESLNALIKRAKMVLNISFYNNSLLETTRIHECLQQNTPVISEIPKLNATKVYDDYAIFIQPIHNEYDELFHHIDRLLKKNTIVQEINAEFDLVMKDTMLNYFNQQKYTLLFHKVNLGCVRSKPMEYNVEKNELYSKPLFAHLHCYDISQFTSIYAPYLYDISKYFHIVVTFSIGYLEKEYSITLLKIPNNGYDIGAKMMMVKYLKDMSIDYSYIYFMHSKTDVNLRHVYFDTLYDNLEKIVKNIEAHDGYFPNLLYKLFPQHNIKMSTSLKQLDFNYPYTNELKHYLNVKDPNFNLFVEGNVYILRKSICERMYGDERLYPLLNENDENDYIYLQSIYKRPLEEIYKRFKHNYQTRMIHDGQIEHSFERTVLSLCDTFQIVKPILTVIIQNSDCISHILEQTYDVHILCTDVLTPVTHERVTYVQENEFQDMIKYVSSGWLMFLETGYRYKDTHSIERLSQHLYNHENIVKVNIPGVNHLSYTNVVIHHTVKWEALYIQNIRKHFTEINDPILIQSN